MGHRAEYARARARGALGLGCHENPNTGLPAPGVRMPWRTYADCERPIEIIAKTDTSIPHRVVSKVFVTCTHYVPTSANAR